MDINEIAKIVVNSLRDPKYVWRTVSAIEKETGLSKDAILFVVQNLDDIVLKISNEYSPEIGPKYALASRVNNNQPNSSKDNNESKDIRLHEKVRTKAVQDAIKFLFSYYASLSSLLIEKNPNAYSKLMLELAALNKSVITVQKTINER